MLVCATQMWGADFNENFCDSTLRVDYIFGGGPGGINVMLDAQSKSAGWAGRRHHLNETPLAGNGTILVTDPCRATPLSQHFLLPFPGMDLHPRRPALTGGRLRTLSSCLSQGARPTSQ